MYEGDPYRAAPRRKEATASAKRRGGKVPFVFMLLFSAMWNYIAWLQLSEADSAFEVMFLLIFIAAGLFTAAMVIYMFLGFFNPKVEVWFSELEPTLGSTLELRWRISGRAERIQAFRVRLEGVERATYRRGTDTTTQRNVFVSIPIAEMSGDLARDGSGSVTIPAGSVPTFIAKNNAIEWSIIVSGEIPRWPDVDEAFEVDVKPRLAAQRRAA